MTQTMPNVAFVAFFIIPPPNAKWKVENMTPATSTWTNYCLPLHTLLNDPILKEGWHGKLLEGKLYLSTVQQRKPYVTQCSCLPICCVCRH